MVGWRRLPSRAHEQAERADGAIHRHRPVASGHRPAPGRSALSGRRRPLQRDALRPAEPGHAQPGGAPGRARATSGTRLGRPAGPIPQQAASRLRGGPAATRASTAAARRKRASSSARRAGAGWQQGNGATLQQRGGRTTCSASAQPTRLRPGRGTAQHHVPLRIAGRRWRQRDQPTPAPAVGCGPAFRRAPATASGGARQLCAFDDGAPGASIGDRASAAPSPERNCGRRVIQPSSRRGRGRWAGAPLGSRARRPIHSR